MRILLIILLLSAQICRAQSYNEWVQQKKTQKKYLLQQIAALKMYGNYLSKGYGITKGGLKVIGDIKQGSLDQDDAFFESFRIVSPKVKQYKKIADIVAMVIRIPKVVNQTISYATKSDQLTAKEIIYVHQVFSKLTSECEADLDRLIDIITNSKLEMSDDERIAAIDSVYASMLDKQGFIQNFSATTRGLIVQRFSELSDINKLKKLNGIK